MGVMSYSGELWKRRGVKMVAVIGFLSNACTQVTSSLSLPAQITVPPPWHALPLSQTGLGLIFSNSSPFSFTQSLFMLPPAAPQATSTKLQASFGPYSVSQLLSSPFRTLSSPSPPFSASLLSNMVEREGDREKGETFKVRALFHWRGNSTGRNCVMLHAFQETEEQKAACITQPPLGLCVAVLTLPKAWFDVDQQGSPDHRQAHKSKHLHRHRHHRGQNSGRPTDKIQLYYSSSGPVQDVRLRCLEDMQEQSQKRLYLLGAVALKEGHWTRSRIKEQLGCLDGLEEEELRLDSNVLIGYQKGPVHMSRPVGVSISLASNFTGDVVVIRLKVKKGLLSLVAHHPLTSYPWTVIIEKNMGSKHDTISIICQKVSNHRGSYSPLVPQQVACLSVIGLHRNVGVAMTVTVHWWVEYSGRNNPLLPHKGVMSTFSFTDRDIVGVAPITESDTIINTAILTGQLVSFPVTVVAVARDGKVSDITAAVTCHSTNEDVIKVSSDCSAIYVDGSESGGGSSVVVEFSLGVLRGTLCLSVWAPLIPLLISVSDPVLNSIEGWSYYTGTECSPVFQRSTVQVLAQFAAKPLAHVGGQLTYMLSSPDWFLDVTELVSVWLRVGDPQVASIDEQHNLVGLQPGVTTLQIISGHWDGVLGSCDITVTDDRVAPGDLVLQLVGGLSMSVKANPTHPSIITATVTAHNTLYSQGQEASLSIWLQFSDDTALLLSAFSTIPFSLRLSSHAESVVVLTPDPNQRVIAQGDGGGPLIKAELLVPTCQLTSNAVQRHTEDLRYGGRIRRLAKGSGWVRVNLESDFHPMANGGPVESVLEISQRFVESDLELYNSVVDNSSLFHDGDNISLTNEIERRVLNPSSEENGVYISTGVENGHSQGQWEDQEVDVGVGAVISLFFLSGFLFLVNCLPCALRERMGINNCFGAEEGEKGIQREEDDELKDGTGEGEGSLQWKTYCLF